MTGSKHGSKTKAQLIHEIGGLKLRMGILEQKYYENLSSLRILRSRMYRVKTSIDTLLEHPTSHDSNYASKTVKRREARKLS